METLCHRIADAVVNVNDAPSGMPRILVKNRNELGDGNAAVFTGTDDAGDPVMMYAVSSVVENTMLGIYRTHRTSSGEALDSVGAVVDPDGFPIGTASRVSWQAGSDADGWSELQVTAGIHNPSGTLDDTHVGQSIRICFFYRDNGGTLEGDSSSSTATEVTDLSPSDREEGTLCSTPISIVNTNTRPMATASIPTPSVEIGGTRAFISADFAFTDGDNPADSLASVTIVSLPTAGTLSVDGTDLTTDDLPETVMAANIGGLAYAPADGASAGDTATFTYSITDDGSDTHPLVGTSSASLISEAYGTTSATATFTIGIATPPDAPLMGMPALAYDSGVTDATEDSVITVDTTGISDGDGIASTTYQWSRADAPMGGGAPADDDYMGITSGGDMAAYTPGDDDVGHYLRACVTITDGHVVPNTYPALCVATAAAVINVNDAPVAMASAVSVGTSDPHTFAAGDFMFSDVDHDSFASVTIVTLPADGSLANGGTAVIAGATIDTGDIGNLVYTAADAAMAGDAPTFTFRVTDAAGASSTDAATFTLNIVRSDDKEPTGVIMLTYAGGMITSATEDSPIGANHGNVDDPNGLPAPATFDWQWQVAQPLASNASFPDANTWTDIAGAAATTTDMATSSFTPLQVHVGDYLRVVLSYEDGDGYMEEVSSAATARVANANDAPTGVLSIAYGGTSQPIADITEPRRGCGICGIGRHPGG